MCCFLLLVAAEKHRIGKHPQCLHAFPPLYHSIWSAEHLADTLRILVKKTILLDQQSQFVIPTGNLLATPLWLQMVLLSLCGGDNCLFLREKLES